MWRHLCAANGKPFRPFPSVPSNRSALCWESWDLHTVQHWSHITKQSVWLRVTLTLSFLWPPFGILPAWTDWQSESVVLQLNLRFRNQSEQLGCSSSIRLPLNSAFIFFTPMIDKGDQNVLLLRGLLLFLFKLLAFYGCLLRSLTPILS